MEKWVAIKAARGNEIRIVQSKEVHFHKMVMLVMTYAVNTLLALFGLITWDNIKCTDNNGEGMYTDISIANRIRF